MDFNHEDMKMAGIGRAEPKRKCHVSMLRGLRKHVVFTNLQTVWGAGVSV